MSHDRITVLEQRVAELERNLTTECSGRAAHATAGRARVWVAPLVVGLALGVASAGTTTRAQVAPTTATVRAPFRVVDSGGEAVFSVENVGGGARVTIKDRNSGSVTLGASDGGGFLVVGGAQGFVRMGVDFQGAGTGPTLELKSGAEDILSVTAKAVSIKAPLTVSPNNAPTLQIANRTIKVTGALSTHDADGNELVAMGRHSGGTFLRVGADKTGGVSIGRVVGGFVSVRGFGGKERMLLGFPDLDQGPVLQVRGDDGVSIKASLGVDDVGAGRLVVGDPAGARGVLGRAKSGGASFALFDNAGADYRVGFLAAPDNSFVRLNSQKNAVHLNADGGGAAVHVFNSAGSAAASLQSTTSGFGKFSLGNPAGDTMVEAGVSTDGVGVVRVGPKASCTTGALAQPCRIVGQKK